MVITTGKRINKHIFSPNFKFHQSIQAVASNACQNKCIYFAITGFEKDNSVCMWLRLDSSRHGMEDLPR